MIAYAKITLELVILLSGYKNLAPIQKFIKLDKMDTLNNIKDLINK